METESQRKERVRVFCRLRPFLLREQQGWSYADFAEQHSLDDQAQATIGTHSKTAERLNADNVVSVLGNKVTVTSPQDAQKKEFTFDAAYKEDVDQKSVYDISAAPLVQDVLNGYNSTILAYGQTSTGKTFTMMGEGDVACDHPDMLAGIIPRALYDLFHGIEKGLDLAIQSYVFLSYVQIYCERLLDLLDPSLAPGSLVIRQDHQERGGIYIENATDVQVASVEDCLRWMKRGNRNRSIASTDMNSHSSRSHAILIIRVERKETIRSIESVEGSAVAHQVKVSQLFLVDLAGSERVKKTNVTGRHILELKAINLSLSALGNCISSLSKQQPHIPYRDSKLTRLLQSSLGGNAKTSLIVTISPSEMEVSETLSTLQFGQRAMKVLVHARKNVLTNDYKSLYEYAQKKLDEKEDALRSLEMALQEKQAKEKELEEQVLESQLRVQQLEFKSSTLQEARIWTEGNRKLKIYDQAPEFELALQDILRKYEKDIEEIKAKCDTQVETYKKAAYQASQEWHCAENELENERTQTLSALQDLKEYKIKFFQLEQEMTERLAELVQENREQDRAHEKYKCEVENQLYEQRERLKSVQAKKVEVEVEKLVPQKLITEMEALYEHTIAKLQSRVVALETTMTASKPQRNEIRSRESDSRVASKNRRPFGNENNQEAERSGRGTPRAMPKIGRVLPASKNYR